MWFPDVEDIEILHAEILAETGGSASVRDRGLLESAVVQPQAAFGELELYASIEAKATALCFSLAKNHPFVDGNKRIAHAAALLFLRMNSMTLDGEIDEHERIILSLAEGNISREELLEWFSRRIAKL